LKSLYVTCALAHEIEGKFAGVYPNLTQGTCLLLGRIVSTKALDIDNYNGAITKTGYYTSLTTTGLMVAYNTTLANRLSNPN